MDVERIPKDLEHLIGVGPPSRFVIKKLLGSGSFGHAWRVEDSTTGIPYAAKIMDTNTMTPKDRGFVANEVKCLEHCNHPNIVQHIMNVNINGHLMIVMEFADGGDLYRQIKARQNGMKYFKEHEVLFVFLQLCLALEHIHSQKMMHRDLKTANVLLTTTGLVKLGDFGFSRQYEDSLSQEVGHTFCGTPYYLSPELWRRAPYSKKAEMWALGVVLYEVIALKRPFGGKSMEELADNIVHGRYDPLPSHYSPELCKLVADLLSLDPMARPSLRQLFSQPYIRIRGLEMLRKSVDGHSKIPQEVRDALCRSVDAALADQTDYEPAHVDPKHEVLKLHTADAGWQDCELTLMQSGVVMRNLKTSEVRSIELRVITSVCPIDAAISNEDNVFALKEKTGKAFWFRAPSTASADEWVNILRHAIPN